MPMPSWFKIHRRPKHHIARDRDGKVLTYQPMGTATVASAALVSKERVRSVMGQRADWQADVWELFDTVSELRSGVNWIANACSRARLYVGRIDPDGSSEPAPVAANHDDSDFSDQGLTPAQVAMLLAPLEELAGGQLGQSEMLRRMATHLNVPGETYLVGFDDPEDSSRRWLVCSSDELTSSGGGVKIQMPDVPNHQVEIDPEQSTILRIWRPHPRLAYRPDSPMVALRGPLRELINVSAHITATAESRLAGAGVLFVPDELTVPSPAQSDGANPLHPDAFTAALIEAMAAPLKNRDSASAIVPLVVRGSAEAGKALKHLSFSTEFDKYAGELRASAIRRIATGMDMPPEILLGMGDTNHWGAWQIEETAIKLHIEPLLGLLCDALTSDFFQPVLKKMGFAAADSYAIWYDTSDLKLRPNRSPEALEARKLGLIGDAPTRRELGFGDEDAPTKEEADRSLVIQILSAAPSLAPSLLPYLGITVPETQAAEAVAEAVTQDPDAAIDTSPAPPAAVPSAPVRQLPASNTGRNNPPAPAAAGLAHSSARIPVKAIEGNLAWRTRCLDMAVRRALERTGNYLLSQQPRSARQQFKDVPLHELHHVLRAEPTHLDRILHNAYREFHAATPAEPCLHEAVDQYVRALLLTGHLHEPQFLDNALVQFRCDSEAA